MQKILLITKNYPPQIGGIEKYSIDLYNRLMKQGNRVKIIAASPRNEWLLRKKGSSNIFLRLIFSALYIVSEIFRLGVFAIKGFTLGAYWASQSDIIWSLDGSIALIGVALGKMFHKKTRVTLHGTDVIWGNRLYQKYMPLFWRKIEEAYVISENTMTEALKRGLNVSNIFLVPHTHDSLLFLDIEEFDQNEFLRSVGVHNPANKIILFSIGRWVERKGFHWFLENVFSELDKEKFTYILAGFGPLESTYREIISKKSLSNVILVGKIDEQTKAKLYKVSDFFIMPNIYTKGDIEGFGLVLLEAEHYGLKSIVADIDGIGGSVGSNGRVLTTENTQEWTTYLKNI